MLGVVPAAGKGTRLRPVTDFIPKELMMYGDMPILGHILNTMNKISQINRVAIVIGHKKGTIIDYVKDGSEFNLEIDYIYQKEPKGLGHAIYTTKDRVKEEDIFILLGDTIIDPVEDVIDMVNWHEKNKPFATIMVEEISNPERFGVIKVSKEDNKIIDLYEKPEEEKIKKEYEVRPGRWYAIVGAYIINKGIYDYLAITPPGKKNEIQLTDALKLALEDGKDIRYYILNGRRIDIGTMESYLEAQEYWFKKYR